MRITNKSDVHTPGTIILELSLAEFAAISKYAEYYVRFSANALTNFPATYAAAAIAAAARFPADSNEFSYSPDFQDKLFK